MKTIEDYVRERIKELDDRKQAIADELKEIDIRSEELMTIVQRMANEPVDFPEEIVNEPVVEVAVKVAEPVMEEVVTELAPEPAVVETPVVAETPVDTNVINELPEDAPELGSMMQQLQAEANTSIEPEPVVAAPPAAPVPPAAPAVDADQAAIDALIAQATADTPDESLSPDELAILAASA